MRLENAIYGYGRRRRLINKRRSRNGSWLGITNKKKRKEKQREREIKRDYQNESRFSFISFSLFFSISFGSRRCRRRLWHGSRPSSVGIHFFADVRCCFTFFLFFSRRRSSFSCSESNNFRASRPFFNPVTPSLYPGVGRVKQNKASRKISIEQDKSSAGESSQKENALTNYELDLTLSISVCMHILILINNAK